MTKNKQITDINSSHGNSVEDEIMIQRQKISDAIRTILTAVGEDPDRDGLQDTPLRVAKAYEELLEGYSQDVLEIVNGALFDVDYGTDEMVIVEDIPYDSLCEHHMLPFSGKAHVAYIPNNKVIGLSKIPRIVEMYARRLQVQERLTSQIASTVEEIISAQGVIVMVEGVHECAALRGIKKKDMNMRTISTKGIFKTDPERKREFFNLIK